MVKFLQINDRCQEQIQHGQRKPSKINTDRHLQMSYSKCWKQKINAKFWKQLEEKEDYIQRKKCKYDKRLLIRNQ